MLFGGGFVGLFVLVFWCVVCWAMVFVCFVVGCWFGTYVVCGCCDCVGLSCFSFGVVVNSVVLTFIRVCNLTLVGGL